MKKHAKATAERKQKEALEYACRDMPGGQIISGSTVAECNYNRKMTEQVLANEKKWDSEEYKDPCPNGYDSGPQCQPPEGDTWVQGQRDWAKKQYEARKRAVKKGTYGRPAKPSNCPPGTHPVGQTGACAP